MFGVHFKLVSPACAPAQKQKAQLELKKSKGGGPVRVALLTIGGPCWGAGSRGQQHTGDRLCSSCAGAARG